MTLEDNETGDDIINPYISLYNPKETSWIALNTQTFGPAQRELIHPHDERQYMKLSYDENRRLYRVVATVGKQDHPFDWEERSIWTRGVRVDGSEDAIALVPIGYLLEDVVRKYFPKSFEYFEAVKRGETPQHGHVDVRVESL